MTAEAMVEQLFETLLAKMKVNQFGDLGEPPRCERARVEVHQLRALYPAAFDAVLARAKPSVAYAGALIVRQGKFGKDT